MTDHRWLEDVEAYALGALDRAERDAFEGHLSGCSICRKAVEEYALLSDSLVEAIPEATLPVGLRARVLDRAASEGREADPAVIPLPPREGRRVPLAYVAAAAAVVVAIWAGWYGRQSAGARDQALSDLADARGRIVQLETDQAQRDSMLAVLIEAGIETATLTATGGEPRVRLYRSRSRDVLLVTAFDLPAAPQGRTYQLWGLAADRDPVSLGLFDTDAVGSAVALRSVPGGLEFAQSAVSEEPAGGSAQPTTTPFLLGSFATEP